MLTSLLEAECPSCHPTNSVTALKAVSAGRNRNSVLVSTAEVSAGRSVQSTVSVEAAGSVERRIAFLISTVSSCTMTTTHS